MNIGLIFPNREKNNTGVRNFTKGFISEILKQDKKNNYILYDDPYFDSELKAFSNVKFETRVTEPQRLDYISWCNQVDVIHSFWNPIDRMSYICPKIFTIYDIIPMIHPEWHTLQHYFDTEVRHSAETADLIITDSNNTKKDVVEWYGIDGSKIKTVYPGLMNTLDFEKSDKTVLGKFGIYDPYIMSVSTIEPRKNLLGLVRGFIEYKKKYRNNAKLVIVGGTGWNMNFEKDIEELGDFRSEIILTGFVTDRELSSLYLNADAVAYVSFYEGFGLPILEALAAGKAVISSNTTSLPEVGGNAVCYCNPYDISDITEAISKVMENKDYRVALEKGAKEQAAMFSYQKAAREMIQIYESLGGSHA